jgi:hypothetical protein
LLVHGEHHEASRVVVRALADKSDLSAEHAEGVPEAAQAGCASVQPPCPRHLPVGPRAG